MGVRFSKTRVVGFLADGTYQPVRPRRNPNASCVFEKTWASRNVLSRPNPPLSSQEWTAVRAAPDRCRYCSPEFYRSWRNCHMPYANGRLEEQLLKRCLE